MTDQPQTPDETPAAVTGSSQRAQDDLVLAEIAAERRRQDAKWGEQNHPDADPVILSRLALDGTYGTPEAVALRLAQEYEIPTAARAKRICQTEAASGGATWIGIAVEEVAEALEAVAAGPDALRAELVQAAAVFVAWIGALDRRRSPVVEQATRQPAETPGSLLDLIRQYGTARHAQGAAGGMGSAPGEYHAKREAAALLARISEQLQPAAQAGSAVVFKLVPFATRAHTECRLYAGPDRDHLALCGELRLRHHEYSALQDALNPPQAAWQPARPGDTPGQLIPGEGDLPQPVDATERAEDAARRFATELEQLRTGLEARGIPLRTGPLGVSATLTALAALDQARHAVARLAAEQDEPTAVERQCLIEEPHPGHRWYADGTPLICGGQA